MTVQRYLKTTIGAKSYKRPLMPRLSPKQKENRLTFCKQENFCRTCYRLHFPTVWSPCSPCHKDTGFVQRTSKGILGERYLAKQLPRLDLNREFVGYLCIIFDGWRQRNLKYLSSNYSEYVKN